MYFVCVWCGNDSIILFYFILFSKYIYSPLPSHPFHPPPPCSIVFLKFLFSCLLLSFRSLSSPTLIRANGTSAQRPAHLLLFDEELDVPIHDMTDQKQVFIFGSFTEEVIQSMQCLQQMDDIKIKFGSLDLETLRSVGIPNTKVSGLPLGEAYDLANPASKQNIFPFSSSGRTQKDLKVALVKVNGYTSSTHSADSGAKEMEPGSAKKQPSPTSHRADNLQKRKTVKQRSLHSFHELSSFSEDDVLSYSANGSHEEPSKESISNESNLTNDMSRNFTPRGLINLGNLCFLNATLQALLSCCPLLDLLQGLRYRNIPENGYPTLRAFVEFISYFDMLTDSICPRNERAILETSTPFRPVMFDSILKSFTPDIADNLSGRPRQEDAQEFLSFVMHQMHDELLKLEGQVSNGNGKNAALVSSTDDGWETIGPRKKTAITRTQSFLPSKLSAIFGGQLKSVVQARGSKESATIQPFLLLHLNIFPDPVCTIEAALQWFSAPETLEGYRGSASGEAEIVSASKSVKILELPEVLILHLMRFNYGSEGSTKLHKTVHFPMELVVGRDLLSSPSSEARKYELVATITHHGRDPSKGHYTADARHPNGSWLHYDDASVKFIPESKVLHDLAYVLFYKQL